MVDYAFIKIWGEQVGVVRWDETEGLASFQYDTKFLTNAWELSPLKMPLASANRIYSFTELAPNRLGEPDSFGGLPGLLADSLPDKYGNQLIDVWLAQRGRPRGSMNPVEKLCFIGSRGMGALEFEPAQLKAAKQSFSIEVESLVSMSKEMLSKREDFSSNIKADEQKAMLDIFKIGTSAGGARPKAVIAYNKKTAEVKSGQAKAPKGFEHWLIKLDGVSDTQFGDSQGWGRVEMAYYLMAKDCGIEMMESQLLEENERAHFMTKRFDREGPETKHHVQTLCAMQHFDYNNIYGYSYEQLFQSMRMLKLTYPEAEQMFRRMVFNVLAVNYDDHTKNFGFILKKGEQWKLAPAYDVCYSYDPKNSWVNQQTLSINGKHKNISKEDLMMIGKANKIKKAQRIIEEIQSVIADWKGYANKVNVSTEKRDDISKTIQALK